MDTTDMKIIDLKDIPFPLRKVSKVSKEWIKQILSIPPHKAWVITSMDTKVHCESVVAAVRRLKKRKEIPDYYQAAERTINGELTVYIINHGDKKK